MMVAHNMSFWGTVFLGTFAFVRCGLLVIIAIRSSQGPRKLFSKSVFLSEIVSWFAIGTKESSVAVDLWYYRHADLTAGITRLVAGVSVMICVLFSVHFIRALIEVANIANSKAALGEQIEKNTAAALASVNTAHDEMIREADAESTQSSLLLVHLSENIKAQSEAGLARRRQLVGN